MAKVREKQASVDVAEKSAASSSVSQRQHKAISGKGVEPTRTVSSKVEKRGAKRSESRKTAGEKGPAGKDQVSQRARLQQTVEAVAAVKAYASIADDDANSTSDAANLSTQEVWRRAARKLEARKGAPAKGRTGLGAPEAQAQGRKMTVSNVSEKNGAAARAGKRKVTGRVQARKQRLGMKAKEAGKAAKSAQAKRNFETAVKAQQAASKKAEAGTAKAALTAISTAIGVPVAAVVAIIVGIAIVIALFAAIFASLFGGAASESYGQMNEVEAAVAQKLKDMGFDNVHTAAIMGNIYAESGFNLGSEEAGGGGMGLMQWTTASSHERLAAIARDLGKPWTDIEVQLVMLEEWINNWDYANSYTIVEKLYGYDSTSWDPEPGTHVSASRKRFDGSNDLRECVEQFCYGCEAPGIPRIKVRYDAAEKYLDMLEHPSAGGNVDLVGGELGDPLTGYDWVLSSGFGPRSLDNHKGIDMAAPEGTPYYAAESGTVLYATNGGGYNGGAGNWVVIDHGNGLVTKYMHSQVTFVTPGQHVNKGDHIGNVGNTGQSFGAHLHFQVEKNGVAVDPLPLIGR